MAVENSTKWKRRNTKDVFTLAGIHTGSTQFTDKVKATRTAYGHHLCQYDIQRTKVPSSSGEKLDHPEAALLTNVVRNRHSGTVLFRFAASSRSRGAGICLRTVNFSPTSYRLAQALDFRRRWSGNPLPTGILSPKHNA